MRTQIIVQKIIPLAFTVLNSNLVLMSPLLIFLLLLILIISPLGGANPFFLVALLALKSVFLSGWLNMFHSCINRPTEVENLPEEEKVLNSLNLYGEFFPGVGKYFQNIFWGVLIFLLLINVAETVIFNLFLDIKTISLGEIPQSFSTKAEILAFWQKISPENQAKLIKATLIDLGIIAVFSYFAMFWAQFVIVKDKNAFSAFIESAKTVFKDPINSFILFDLTVFGFIVVVFLNIFLSVNALTQLISLILLVYSAAYFTLLNFLYFENYAVKS